MAEPELNPNWRNFYITVAHELQGLPLPKDINGGLKAFGFWFPADGNQGFGAQGYVLHLRHGIAEFIEETAGGKPLTETDVAAADFPVSMTKPALDALPQAEAQGQAEFAKAWEAATKSGQIQCLKRADAADACLEKFATHFKLYFDPKPTGLPPLAGR